MEFSTPKLEAIYDKAKFLTQNYGKNLNDLPNSDKTPILSEIKKLLSSSLNFTISQHAKSKYTDMAIEWMVHFSHSQAASFFNSNDDDFFQSFHNFLEYVVNNQLILNDQKCTVLKSAKIILSNSHLFMKKIGPNLSQTLINSLLVNDYSMCSFKATLKLLYSLIEFTNAIPNFTQMIYDSICKLKEPYIQISLIKFVLQASTSIEHHSTKIYLSDNNFDECHQILKQLIESHKAEMLNKNSTLQRDNENDDQIFIKFASSDFNHKVDGWLDFGDKFVSIFFNDDKTKPIHFCISQISQMTANGKAIFIRFVAEKKKIKHNYQISLITYDLITNDLWTKVNDKLTKANKPIKSSVVLFVPKKVLPCSKFDLDTSIFEETTFSSQNKATTENKSTDENQNQTENKDTTENKNQVENNTTLFAHLSSQNDKNVKNNSKMEIGNEVKNDENEFSEIKSVQNEGKHVCKEIRNDCSTNCAENMVDIENEIKIYNKDEGNGYDNKKNDLLLKHDKFKNQEELNYDHRLLKNEIDYEIKKSEQMTDNPKENEEVKSGEEKKNSHKFQNDVEQPKDYSKNYSQHENENELNNENHEENDKDALKTCLIEKQGSKLELNENLSKIMNSPPILRVQNDFMDTHNILNVNEINKNIHFQDFMNEISIFEENDFTMDCLRIADTIDGAIDEVSRKCMHEMHDVKGDIESLTAQLKRTTCNSQKEKSLFRTLNRVKIEYSKSLKFFKTNEEDIHEKLCKLEDNVRIMSHKFEQTQQMIQEFICQHQTVLNKKLSKLRETMLLY
ncbi:hypothetical protein TRFO_08633 [Tritrichomonas foetus]|uniref:Uncharacterized protein n=1 Tax=Tritrichomonas foetus TaxID=1144522 RepID=A0A1J4JKX4_9EUKA|nr:hypothetical protein TRFO_08633 [Tritrichomonas foetus]|eukprot:OHS99063.1 hypothetical protein TRFO_08633 [Tritrichomonas foetus]